MGVFEDKHKKAALPEEMERIKKSGGEVKTNVEGGSGPMRVYKLNDGNPGLAVARSLGDCYGHECGVRRAIGVI